MQAMLNFKKEEWPLLKEWLLGFPKKPANPFESLRTEIHGCSVTLFESGKLVIQGARSEEVKNLVLSSLDLGNETILGIDEAGRGEGFGDFCMAVVLGKTRELRELRDSKKISDFSEKKKKIESAQVPAVVVCFSAQTVDAFRKSGVNLNQLEAKTIDQMVMFFSQAGFSWDKIVVDGNPLPVESKGIRFVPKADDSEPVVGAASILAKTAREESGRKEKRATWKTAFLPDGKKLGKKLASPTAFKSF